MAGCQRAYRSQPLFVSNRFQRRQDFLVGEVRLAQWIWLAREAHLIASALRWSVRHAPITKSLRCVLMDHGRFNLDRAAGITIGCSHRDVALYCHVAAMKNDTSHYYSKELAPLFEGEKSEVL